METHMSDAECFVTLGGECLEASLRGELDPVNRDGLLYKFHLTDMQKNRGKRLVSVFAPGSVELALPDHKQRIQTIILNVIRRSFDNGDMSFDQPFDEHHYKEISLSTSDLEKQPIRSDTEIQQYIIHKAYWLAYRFPMQPQREGIIYPIPFDESADLDYLCASSGEVRRNIRRLEGQGLLEKVLEGHARPTERLLSDYESRVQPAKAVSAPATASERDDRRFARLAIEEARKSVAEDRRVHPKVGVVIVKDGRVLATAHRGEFPKCHAEYAALEKKLPDVPLAGSTVYTTLEPCTSRNHPKVPCADRLAERKVARVVIGILDPDDRISGRGQRTLRRAGIATAFFDDDLMAEIEELNREFIRERELRTTQNKVGEQSFDARQEPTKSSALEVEEITLKALYMNADTDSHTFKCSSVTELPPEYVHNKAADGAIMRSIIEPPTVLIRGIDADSVHALAWAPNRLEFHDAKSGEAKEYIGGLRDSTEPNTVKFAIDGEHAVVSDSASHKIKSRARTTGEPRDLPSTQPCVAPAGYGVQKSDGRTGLHLANENDTTAFDVVIPDIKIGSSRLHFWGRELYRLSKNEGTVFLQADIELSKGHGLLGNGLAQEMARQNVGTIPFTIQYRDSQNNHFVSHCLIERDVHERSGIATRFLRQELLETPGSLNVDPERPYFSLDAYNGEIHSYTGSPSYFSLRNCGGRTARDIRFDPVYSESLHHAIRLDRISSLGKDESVPLSFQAGADETWLHKGMANHLISLLEDNPQKKPTLTYIVTIRFLDANVPLVEQHLLEGESLPKGGIRLRAYPLTRPQD
jgi:pyrimidine deaminase RibD-like protein